MFRPMTPRMFEPDNPEHTLVDLLTTEMHQLESPEIVYWKVKMPDVVDAETHRVDPTATNYLDDLDKVYGEKSSGDGLTKYYQPEQIFGKLDSQPIIQELLKMGLITKTEIDLYVNIAHIQDVLGRPPMGGDLFRITYLIRNPDGELKGYYVYYEVSTVWPVDLYNYQYINYQINAEQTNMSNVPDEIKNFDIESKTNDTI